MRELMKAFRGSSSDISARWLWVVGLCKIKVNHRVKRPRGASPMEAAHHGYPWHVGKPRFFLLPWPWASSLGPESNCGGRAGNIRRRVVIQSLEPSGARQFGRSLGCKVLPIPRLTVLWRMLPLSPPWGVCGKPGLSCRGPLCSSSFFLTEGGWGGQSRLGDPDCRLPLSSNENQPVWRCPPGAW